MMKKIVINVMMGFLNMKINVIKFLIIKKSKVA